MKYYAGIGSRTTPHNVMLAMTLLAEKLRKRGYILRSGGAEGADTAFADGAGTDKLVYRPNQATRESIDIAMANHPNPVACKDYVRRLHGRNTLIVLGPDLKTLADFVICWTPGGETIGGTGLGIRIAKSYGIPVYNLFEPGVPEALKDYLDAPQFNQG